MSRVMDAATITVPNDPDGPVSALNDAELGCWFDKTERKHGPGIWTYTSPYLPTTALAQIAWLINAGWGVKIAPRDKRTVLIKVWAHRK